MSEYVCVLELRKCEMCSQIHKTSAERKPSGIIVVIQPDHSCSNTLEVPVKT